MRTVQLGKQGPQVSVIAASLSAPPAAHWPLHQLAIIAPATEDPADNGESQAAQALRLAREAGVNFIDTDWITANGHAQEVLGRMLPELGRDALIVGGKGGPRLTFQGALTMDNSRGNLMNQCHDSLFRLKTGWIDLFQVHWPDATPVEQTARGLLDLRHHGLVRHFGACNYSAAQAAALHAQAPLASVAAPLSLLRRAPDGLAEWCRAHEVALLATDPLCAGLLSGRFTGDETFSETDADTWFTQPAFGRACALYRELEDWSQARGLRAATVAAAWCLHQPGVSAVLCPARDPAEIALLLPAADLRLTPADLAALETLRP